MATPTNRHLVPQHLTESLGAGDSPLAIKAIRVDGIILGFARVAVCRIFVPPACELTARGQIVQALERICDCARALCAHLLGGAQPICTPVGAIGLLLIREALCIAFAEGAA
jgi:hypothetical protein